MHLLQRWTGNGQQYECSAYLMSVLKACAMVGKFTEVKGVVYCTSALLRICMHDKLYQILKE